VVGWKSKSRDSLEICKSGRANSISTSVDAFQGGNRVTMQGKSDSISSQESVWQKAKTCKEIS
jgi:hypothetical protein